MEAAEAMLAVGATRAVEGETLVEEVTLAEAEMLAAEGAATLAAVEEEVGEAAERVPAMTAHPTPAWDRGTAARAITGRVTL